MLPVQEEPPPVALLPELPPLLLEVFPEPPVLLFPVSPPPPVGALSEFENDPQAEATMAPTDTTTDTGTKRRNFFMAASPFAESLDVNSNKRIKGSRTRRLVSRADFDSCTQRV
jgi:hypothetical protein